MKTNNKYKLSISNKISVVLFTLLLSGCFYQGTFWLTRDDGIRILNPKKINRIEMFQEMTLDNVDSINIILFHSIDSTKINDKIKKEGLLYEYTKWGQTSKFIGKTTLKKISQTIEIVLRKKELQEISKSYYDYLSSSIKLLISNKDNNYPTTGRTYFVISLDSNNFNNSIFNNNYYGEICFSTNKFTYFSQFYPNELYFDFYYNDSSLFYEHQALTFPRVAADRFTNEFINAILQYQKQKLSITDTNSIYDQWYKYSN